jgi:hypothetical protein
MPQESESKRLSKALARPPTDDREIGLPPSKATSDAVRKFLKQYVKEVNKSVELSQASKTMYIDFAECFVRWMHGGFQPGLRGANSRTLRRLRGRTL